MTKVESRFKVGNLDLESLNRIAGLGSIYGILHVTSDIHRR